MIRDLIRKRPSVLCYLAVLFLLGSYASATAQPQRQNPPQNQPQSQGRQRPPEKYEKLPGNAQKVRHGKSNLFFYLGIFYEQMARGYMAVEAPIGAIVLSLPAGFQTRVVNGTPYYRCEGAWYRKHPNGYIVTTLPQDNPATVQAAPSTGAGTGDTVVVLADLLNVRSGPGTNFPVIRQVPIHTRVTIQGTSQEWIYIALPDGTLGWVMSRFTSARNRSNASG